MIKLLSVIAGLGAALWFSATSGPAVNNPRWFWSGALTSSSIQIKARVQPDTAISILVEDGQGPAQRIAGRTDSWGSATFDVTGLMPDRRYRYEVFTDRLLGTGGFRTPGNGPSSFTIAFASCATTGSNHEVFDAIRAADPLLFLHMGDLHYQNITRNEVTAFRKAYDQVMTSTRQSRLFREVPIQYMWDDHDFGPNDSNRTSPSRDAALESYRLFAPHHPLAGPDTPVHQAFTLGRIRFIVLDTRSARAPVTAPVAERTMLGAEQLEWLERELTAAASAPLVVLVNSVPWITKADETTIEGWAPYAEERQRIADMLVRTGVAERMIMLSGDAHQLAFDDGTHSQYSALHDTPSTGFVVAHAAPLDRWTTQKGGPYSHGTARARGQFGTLAIRDNGQVVEATLEGHRNFKTVDGMRIQVRCEQGGPCRAQVG